MAKTPPKDANQSAKEVMDLATQGVKDIARAADVRPAFIKLGDLTGTENIKSSEIQLPRLAIAQGLSDQVNPDSSKYIEDLKLFHMFNDLTGEVHFRGPVRFIPLKRQVKRIEFIPRKDGGGVKDFDVPENDPRNEWTTDPDTNERCPPKATKFVEFVVLLFFDADRAPEPIVLSIKQTNKWNREATRRLSTFIKLRQAPIYAGYYMVSSKQEKNDSGTFGIYIINNAGFVTEEPIYKYAEEFANSLEGKTIETQREPGEDDVVDDDEAASFNPPGAAGSM